MTPSAEIEPGPHWWKASALTTRPILPPLQILSKRQTKKAMIFLLVIKNILNNVLSINIILVIFNRRGHDDLGDHHFECGDLK